MKHIQKKISLEQFKSRMPSIIPAFYDNGKYYEFNGKSNFDDDNQRIPYTNYGMIPYGVKWDRGKYKFYVDDKGIEHYVSYNTLSSWFHFIVFYLNLIKKHGCLKDNYISAEEYGNYENNQNYNDYDYINFDNKIKDICGEENDKTLYEQAKDTYDFMVSEYFPRFDFNIEFKDDLEKLQELKKYWHKNYLSINDVNYWINWFEQVKINIGEISDISDCLNTNNCCDCEKFFNLGGEDMLNKLKKFISKYFILHRIDKKYISINEINDWIDWFKEKENEFNEINTIDECYDIEKCEDCLKYFKLNEFVNLKYLEYVKTNIVEKFANEDGNLIIPEVRKLINWFEEISNKLNGINDQSECVNTDFCDDCENFFKLGGYDTINDLKEFISLYDSFFIYLKPELNIDIKLSSTVDDLGEFSIFYDDWDGGVDFSYSDGKTTNGAIVQYNNQDWVLDNGKGYIYSTEFKEYYFGCESGMTADELSRYKDNNKSNIIGENNQFSRLIESHAIDASGKIKFEFNGNVNPNEKYAYDFYGKKVSFTGNITNNFCKLIYQKFPIINLDNGFFKIKGNIYEAYNTDYIRYNNNCYQVTYDNENNPITNVNGVNYYGVYIDDEFIFEINEQKILISSGSGIKINSQLYIETNGQIKYGQYTYNKIFKYCIINGESILINNMLKTSSQILNDKEYMLIDDNMILGDYVDELNNQSSGYTTDNSYLYIVTPFIIYNADEITGYTESKLSSFIAATDVVYDNLGNKLPGTYINQQQLQDGDFIGLIYKPNTVIHLSKEYDSEGNIIENRYWGDYLSDIILYYTDNNNNVLTTEKKLNIDGNLIDIIQALNSELNEKEGKLKCKFIYYMGCIMNINQCTDNENNCVTIINDGVKYIDTTELVENTYKYFLNDYTCYIIKYYDIIYDEIHYHNDTYNFNSSVNKAQFSTKVTTFIQNDKFSCNGWVDFPVIREEYRLGSSSLSNIDVDVDINRGTARAFDQHIKLLEVNSLESLEQYGNGFFNIITN